MSTAPIPASCGARVCTADALIGSHIHRDGGGIIPVISTAWRDRQGDLWRYDTDGLLHLYGMRPFAYEEVEKRWGPLVPARDDRPTPPPLTPAEALARLSQWVDDSYPPDLAPEAADWRRLTKVCEEAGEAVSAYAGSLGENPRKGVTHTSEDALREILDAATAAVAAVEHFTGNKGLALTMLNEHILAVATRAGVASGEGA